MTSHSILAQSVAGGDITSTIFLILPYLLIFAVFWFFLIRPQQLRAKTHREKIAMVRTRDMVVTAGGMVGKVVRVEEEHVTVEIANGVAVKVVKNTLSDIISNKGKNTDVASANDTAPAGKASKSKTTKKKSATKPLHD